jgi:hypothetical protein
VSSEIFDDRRRQIWEAMHPGERVVKTDAESNLPAEQARQIVVPVAKHGHAQAKAFAAETASVTGENVRNIQRHLARAEALGDTLLDRITGTSLDKGVELDALVKGSAA